MLGIRSEPDLLKMFVSFTQPFARLSAKCSCFLFPAVDFIAMDLKSDLETYYMAAGVKVEKEKIKKSVELIKDSDIDYEFRTTVVPGLFDEKTAIEIGELLKGSKRYVLQQFNNEEDMINKSFKRKKPYTVDKLKKFKKILENYIDEVKISGI